MGNSHVLWENPLQYKSLMLIPIPSTCVIAALNAAPGAGAGAAAAAAPKCRASGVGGGTTTGPGGAAEASRCWANFWRLVLGFYT